MEGGRDASIDVLGVCWPTDLGNALLNPEDIVDGVTQGCTLHRDDVRTGICSLMSSRRWLLALVMVRVRLYDLSTDEELDGRDG